MNLRKLLKSLALTMACVVSNAAAQAQPISSAATDSSPLADLVKIRSLMTNKSVPIIWVFTGDSITHGASHTHGERSYPEHFAERIRWELDRRRDVVINTGISGDTAQGILKDFEHRVARFKPEVVSLMIGMNDCARGPQMRDQFEANLRELVHRIRAAGAVPILHTTNPIDTNRETKRNDLPAYDEIIAKVAKAEHVVLVDHWSHWRREPSWLQEWLNDPIHPNARGHREFARLMFRALEIYDEKSPTCQPVDKTAHPK
jgi:lysophospholipase L1-like esterase